MRCSITPAMRRAVCARFCFQGNFGSWSTIDAPFSRVYAAAGMTHSAVPVTVDQLLEITGGTEVEVSEAPA